MIENTPRAMQVYMYDARAGMGGIFPPYHGFEVRMDKNTRGIHRKWPCGAIGIVCARAEEMCSRGGQILLNRARFLKKFSNVAFWCTQL